MNNYTSEQLLKHGDLILEFERSGGTLKIEFQRLDMKWYIEDVELQWCVTTEYRKAPQPLYTNSIGEEFYEDDMCFWWDKVNECFDSTSLSFITGHCENRTTTDTFKNMSGALTAAAKYYADKGE